MLEALLWTDCAFQVYDENVPQHVCRVALQCLASNISLSTAGPSSSVSQMKGPKGRGHLAAISKTYLRIYDETNCPGTCITELILLLPTAANTKSSDYKELDCAWGFWSGFHLVTLFFLAVVFRLKALALFIPRCTMCYRNLVVQAHWFCRKDGINDG